GHEFTTHSDLVRVQDPENHAVLLIGSGLAGAKSSYWSASARLTTHALQLRDGPAAQISCGPARPRLRGHEVAVDSTPYDLPTIPEVVVNATPKEDASSTSFTNRWS